MDFNLTFISALLPLALTAYLHLSHDLIQWHPALVTTGCATIHAHLGLILWDHLLHPDLAPLVLPLIRATSYTRLLAAVVLHFARRRTRSTISA